MGLPSGSGPCQLRQGGVLILNGSLARCLFPHLVNGSEECLPPGVIVLAKSVSLALGPLVSFEWSYCHQAIRSVVEMLTLGGEGLTRGCVTVNVQ